MNNKRRWRSLTHKIEHLKLEIEDIEETSKKYEEEFLKNLAEIIDGSLQQEVEVEQGSLSTQSQSSVKFHLNDKHIDEQILPSANEKVDVLPEDIKKLWKTIATMTHPDRTKNDQRKTELYLAAVKAVESGSVDEIIKIAVELGIELPEASVAAVTKLESIASDLQKQISEQENSILWQWGKASPEIKNKIMDAYILMKRYKKKVNA